jgi:hypothetical protein
MLIVNAILSLLVEFCRPARVAWNAFWFIFLYARLDLGDDINDTIGGGASESSPEL